MPAGIRPTQSLTRKALFDIIGHDLSGVNFLDLFAGSGAVGIEAHSLGAEKVVMVERESKCLRTIRENLTILGIAEADPDRAPCQVIGGDVFATIKLLARQKTRFDMVFIDPPYRQDMAKKALKTLGAYDILQPVCYIVIEISLKEILPQTEGRFSLIKTKRYGKSMLAVYEGK